MLRLIQHNSREYEQMVQLRITQLLKPIGIPASYIDPAKEKNDVFIGAFENNEIIGGCILTPKDLTTIQLRQMAVRSDYRGKNIGAAIIEFAEQISREKNFSIVMMHARDPVIRFYERCGYKIVGEQFFEVGMGHHKMEKALL